MFLKALNQDEKGKFLSVAHQLASADGKTCNEEMLHLAAYASEMEIANTPDLSKSLDNNLSFFAQASETTKKIVMVELIAIAHIDGEFCSDEQKTMQYIAEAIGVPSDFCTQAINWVERVTALNVDGFKLVGLA